MKRKSLLFLLLFALIAPWAANAQTVTIGTGTTTHNSAPIANFYNYSMAEMIFTANEIGTTNVNTILSLAFESTSDVNKDYGVTVYMKNISASEFATTDEYVVLSADDVVFTGTVTPTTGWNTIELPTPFTYDNTGNLLIAVNKTSGGYSGSTAIWKYTSTSSTYKMLYGQRDSGGTYDPTTALTLSLNYERPNVQLVFGTPPTCPKPTLGEAEYITEEGASFQWTENGSATNWVLEYSTDENFTDATSVNRPGIPLLAITGLNSATTYYVRVKADCGGGDQSPWSNVISFTTLCDAQGIPYTYGFEESEPFDCWTVISGNISRINGNSHNGNYRLDFRGTTSNMIALPQFTEPTNTLRVEFYTRPENTNSSCGKFAIGYMTDLDDASTFVAVETYPVSDWTSASYVKKTVDLVNVPARANIAMRQFDCTTNYYWFVDDVTVKAIPSCLAPTGLAADATTNSAELSWTANSGETAWTLYWKKTTDGNYTEVANATNPYTLNDLDPATNYQYYVVANCSADDASEASEVFSFITECEVFNAYPYAENFDGYTVASAYTPTARTLPVCWNAINTCTHNTYKYYPTIYYYSSTNYAHTTPNSLRFYSYYYSSTDYDPQPQYAILPEMENLAGKEISLWVRGLNVSSTFKVGLMTDPNDASTFVEITNDANPTMTTSYQEFTFVIPADATANYVAIMIEAANSSRSSNGVYIDDITINNPPACPKPTDLTIVENSVTAHTAQLSWTSDAEAWEICLNGDEEHPVAANANPFELTGLTDGMTYTAKVRAVCDGIPSEWCNNTVSFNTPIACPAPAGLAVSGTTESQATLNWTGTSDSYDVMYKMATYADGLYEEFGTTVLPSGWERYNGLLTNGTATLTSTTGGWNFGEGNGVFDSHAKVNIYSTYQRWLVTPAFTVLQDASTLSFDLALTSYYGSEVPAPATTGTDDKFIVLISTDNMSTWITLREWNNSGSEYVYNNIANTATGEEVEIDLSAYVGQSVRIAFYGESTEANADNNLHIDNVLCGIVYEDEWQTVATGVTGNTYTLTGLSPETEYDVKVLSNCEGETGHEATISFTTEAACMVPSELEVLNTTTTTAVLTWRTNSTAWQIQVNEEDPIDVTENPYTLEGLNHSTAFTFKVRANCGGNYTEWSESMSFTTECGAIATYPWEENFNNYSTTATSATAPSTYPNDNLPICWQFLNRSETTSTYPQVFLSSFSTYAVSGNCLFFKSSKDTPLYAILPQFDEDIAGLWLNFTYRNEGVSTSNGTLIVGYMTDPTDATTFTEVLSCAQTTTKTEIKDVMFTDAPAGSYIAFKYQGGSTNNYYMSIDNVSVITAPTCLRPTELAATTTTNSATLSWTANSEETEWTVYYREVTDEPGDYTEVTGVTVNPYTLPNLNAATEYEFYVVANCSADDASEPSVVASFFTLCELITDFPWNEDFEDFAASNSGVKLEVPCWVNEHLEGTGTYFFEVYSSTSGVGGNITKTLRLHDMAEGTMTKLVLPGMTLPNANYQFTLDVYRSNSTYNDSYPYEGIRVYASTDGEIEGATELAFIPRQYTEGNEVIPAEDAVGWYTYSLPLGMSGTCYIILRGESQYCTATYMDNFVVEEIPVSTVTQTLELTAGYNWVSLSVEVEDPIEMLDQVKAALGDKGITIEGNGVGTEYLGDGEWIGDLDYEGMYNEQMYLIQVSEDCTVELAGTPIVDPTLHVIDIYPGYNWIGFPYSEELDVNEALMGFEALDEDMIESPEGISYYFGEWMGDVMTLVPGQGYLYFSNSEDQKTLVIQIGGAKARAKVVSPK